MPTPVCLGFSSTKGIVDGRRRAPDLCGSGRGAADAPGRASDAFRVCGSAHALAMPRAPPDSYHHRFRRRRELDAGLRFGDGPLLQTRSAPAIQMPPIRSRLPHRLWSCEEHLEELAPGPAQRVKLARLAGRPAAVPNPCHAAETSLAARVLS